MNNCYLFKICLVNDSNVTSLRVTKVYKNKGQIVIEIDKNIGSTSKGESYTWFAVMELADNKSDVKLDIIKK